MLNFYFDNLPEYIVGIVDNFAVMTSWPYKINIFKKIILFVR